MHPIFCHKRVWWYHYCISNLGHHQVNLSASLTSSLSLSFSVSSFLSKLFLSLLPWSRIGKLFSVSCFCLAVFLSLFVVVRWPLLFISNLKGQVKSAVVSCLWKIKTFMDYAPTTMLNLVILMIITKIAVIGLRNDRRKLKFIMRS